MHIPAFEGNDETDPYDAYDLLYTLTFDVNKPTEYDCTIEDTDHTYENKYHFVSDRGLSDEELLKLLEENSWYADDEYGRLIKFNAAERSCEEMIKNSGYYEKSEVKEIKYLGVDKYQLTIHFPAFEGNDEADPHAAYDLIYTIDFDSDVPTEFGCVVEDTAHSMEYEYFYVSDKGLSLDELLKLLEANSHFFCEETRIICWFTAAEKTYNETMDATSYFFEAKITDMEYLFEKEYRLTMHVDAMAGNDDVDGHGAYDVTLYLTYDPASPKVFYGYFVHSNYSTEGMFVTDNSH